MPELFPDSSHVYNMNCNGCKRHKQDIMVTFAVVDKEKKSTTFHDVFLSQYDAIRLQIMLSKRITENYEYLPVDHGRPNQIDNIKK